MNIVHTDVCILGGGPAAILAGHFLRQKGIESVTVANSPLGMLAPIIVNGHRIASIPIFINSRSPLYARLMGESSSFGEPLQIAYTNLELSATRSAILPRSYASFVTKRFPHYRLPLLLAEKHLGPIVLTDELPELRRKLMRHYPDGVPNASKVGFIEGVSPYLAYIERNHLNIPAKAEIHRIDLKLQTVTTDSYVVKYSRLLSTLHLKTFMRLAGLEAEFTLQSGGAQFAIFISAEELVPNHAVYDCSAHSPIYRAFVPSSPMIVAQTSRACWEWPDDLLKRGVESLLGLRRGLELYQRYTLDECYPLGVSDLTAMETLTTYLTDLRVTMFGRFAQWQYLDLDELNWEFTL